MAVAEQAKPAVSQNIPVYNPITSELIGEVVESTPEDVKIAVQRARDAQPAWAARRVEDRARIIRKWGDLLWADKQNAMRIIRDETGKNETGAFVEMVLIDNAVTYYVNHGPRLLRPERRAPGFPLIQRAKVYHKPHGVVGYITPWNYPMILAMVDSLPALIAGNTVVYKPSEITPYSVLYAVGLLHQAGVPVEVAQVVTGSGQAGAALVEEVDYVCFTGSTAVGRKIARRAGERLIPCSLELGGKDPLIVLADADLDLAAKAIIDGTTENAGQVCVSVERIYAEAPIYDALVERVLRLVQTMKISAEDGLDVHMGSMTNEREVLRVERHIQDAVDKGAKLAWGGKRLPELGPLFIQPSVLTDVDHSMLVMQEESFGPLIPIMKVSSAQEAIRLANDSMYGISATIFTRDLDHGELLAQQLNTGDVGINRAAAALSSPHLPWGGQRESGNGRRGGPEGLMRYTTPQSIVVDTMLGATTKPGIFDTTVLTALKILRILRRYLPGL